MEVIVGIIAALFVLSAALGPREETSIPRGTHCAGHSRRLEDARSSPLLAPAARLTVSDRQAGLRPRRSRTTAVRWWFGY